MNTTTRFIQRSSQQSSFWKRPKELQVTYSSFRCTSSLHRHHHNHHNHQHQQQLFFSSTRTTSYQNSHDIQITGVSDEVNQRIKLYANKQQTSASLLTLMKTGRGEYLHKTYADHDEHHSDDEKVATDKILMQVGSYVLSFLLCCVFVFYTLFVDCMNNYKTIHVHL